MTLATSSNLHPSVAELGDSAGKQQRSDKSNKAVTADSQHQNIPLPPSVLPITPPRLSSSALGKNGIPTCTPSPGPVSHYHCPQPSHSDQLPPCSNHRGRGPQQSDSSAIRKTALNSELATSSHPHGCCEVHASGNGNFSSQIEYDHKDDNYNGDINDSNTTGNSSSLLNNVNSFDRERAPYSNTNVPDDNHDPSNKRLHRNQTIEPQFTMVLSNPVEGNHSSPYERSTKYERKAASNFDDSAPANATRKKEIAIDPQGHSAAPDIEHLEIGPNEYHLQDELLSPLRPKLEAAKLRAAACADTHSRGPTVDVAPPISPPFVEAEVEDIAEELTFGHAKVDQKNRALQPVFEKRGSKNESNGNLDADSRPPESSGIHQNESSYGRSFHANHRNAKSSTDAARQGGQDLEGERMTKRANPMQNDIEEEIAARPTRTGDCDDDISNEDEIKFESANWSVKCGANGRGGMKKEREEQEETVTYDAEGRTAKSLIRADSSELCSPVLQDDASKPRAAVRTSESTPDGVSPLPPSSPVAPPAPSSALPPPVPPPTNSPSSPIMDLDQPSSAPKLEEIIDVEAIPSPPPSPQLQTQPDGNSVTVSRVHQTLPEHIKPSSGPRIVDAQHRNISHPIAVPSASASIQQTKPQSKPLQDQTLATEASHRPGHMNSLESAASGQAAYNQESGRPSSLNSKGHDTSAAANHPDIAKSSRPTPFEQTIGSRDKPGTSSALRAAKSRNAAPLKSLPPSLTLHEARQKRTPTNQTLKTIHPEPPADSPAHAPPPPVPARKSNSAHETHKPTPNTPKAQMTHSGTSSSQHGTPSQKPPQFAKRPNSYTSGLNNKRLRENAETTSRHKTDHESSRGASARDGKAQTTNDDVKAAPITIDNAEDEPASKVQKRDRRSSMTSTPRRKQSEDSPVSPKLCQHTESKQTMPPTYSKTLARKTSVSIQTGKPRSPNSREIQDTKEDPPTEQPGKSRNSTKDKEGTHSQTSNESRPQSVLDKNYPCTVEVAAYGGHRISTYINGKKYVGWLAAVNLPPEPPRFLEGVPSETGAAVKTDNVQQPQKNHSAPYVDVNRIPSRSVLIIGAGIAGVAAARVLADRGFYVTVLEARSRIGGRIATDWSSGSPIELGACFIHGSYGNPLSQIAREAELRTYSPLDVGKLIYSNGKVVDEVTDMRATAIWSALIRRARRVAESKELLLSGKDVSLGTLMSRLKEKAIEKTSNDMQKKWNGMNQLLSWHAANLEAACAADMPELSAKHYDMDDKCGFSGMHEIVRDGYSSIVHALAKNLNIITNAKVVTIEGDVPFITFGNEGKQERRRSAVRRRLSSKNRDSKYDPNSKVKYLEGTKVKAPVADFEAQNFEVTTHPSGIRVTTEVGEEFVAEWCIVTIPLGVLKANAVQFEPELPAWKQQAIESIGFGLVNKIVLRFKSPFWVNGKEMAGQPADGPDQIGRVTNEHGVMFMFLSLVRCTGAPVLIATTSGSFAHHIETLPDSEVVEMAMLALRQMFSSKQLTEPVDYKVTRWGSDELSRGSYSFAKVGTTPRDYVDMGEPYGKVCFAGEATDSNHPATAHGAFMSGVREAGRIIRKSVTDVDTRRRYARELFLLQEPHASFASLGSNAVGKEVKEIPRVNGNSNRNTDTKNRIETGNRRKKPRTK